MSDIAPSTGSVSAETKSEETVVTVLGRTTVSSRVLTPRSSVGFSRSFPILSSAMLLSAAITVASLSLGYRPTTLASSVTSPNPITVAARPDLQEKARREFLRLQKLHGTGTSPFGSTNDVPEPSAASGSSASVESAPVVQSKALFPRFDNKQGVYLSAPSVGRTAFFDQTIDNLLAASGSALVFDVKGGVVMFHSAAPMATSVGLVKPFYELPAIIAKAHEKGIYVIGRFVAIKDAGLTSKLPETRIKNPKTGKVIGETFVDPGNDTAIEYNMQVICELAQAGIDEVNLDYIRFSTAEFGELRAYTGAEKADRVEKFIRAARQTIDRCGPATRLGLSTFAILGWNYAVNVETLGQDVVRFAPLVDVISPMAYPSTFAQNHYYTPGKDPRSRMYYLVYRTLTGYAKLLGDNKGKIRPWVQGYFVSQQNVTDEIEAVYDAGFCGFTVWNANNNYGPAFAAMKRDTAKPGRCR